MAAGHLPAPFARACSDQSPLQRFSL